jgi:hypothetical protein
MYIIISVHVFRLFAVVMHIKYIDFLSPQWVLQHFLWSNHWLLKILWLKKSYKKSLILQVLYYTFYFHRIYSIKLDIRRARILSWNLKGTLPHIPSKSHHCRTFIFSKLSLGSLKDTPTVPRTTIPRTTIPRTTIPRTTLPRSDNP